MLHARPTGRGAGWAIVRGTVLGFLIGVLPGAGPTIASFLAYTVEKKVSKHPEEFGHGAIEGVAGARVGEQRRLRRRHSCRCSRSASRARPPPR